MPNLACAQPGAISFVQLNSRKALLKSLANTDDLAVARGWCQRTKKQKSEIVGIVHLAGSGEHLAHQDVWHRSVWPGDVRVRACASIFISVETVKLWGVSNALNDQIRGIFVYTCHK